MFPPSSPMTERIRMEAETRELEHRAASRAQHHNGKPRFPRLRAFTLPKLHLSFLNNGSPRRATQPMTECCAE